MNQIMKGKRGLIMGLTNEKSIAWATAKILAEQGAEIAFSYPNESIKKRVIPLGESLGSKLFFECNVTEKGHIANTFYGLQQAWKNIDFVVHAVAFSDKNELKGRYADT